MSNDRVIKIMWYVCLIPLIIGVILMTCATSKVEYSTDEYWVAKDYHHVYEIYSGEIVDLITKEETCEIDGDTITVTTRKEGLYSAGIILTIIFGMFTVGMIWSEIENSEWLENFKNSFK